MSGIPYHGSYPTSESFSSHRSRGSSSPSSVSRSLFPFVPTRPIVISPDRSPSYACAQVRASESTPRSSPSSRSGSRTSRWDTARTAGGSISSFAVGNWTVTRTAGAILGTCGARCRLPAGSYTCYSRCDPRSFCEPRKQEQLTYVRIETETNKKTGHVFLRRRSSRPIFGQVRGRLWDFGDQVHHIRFHHAGIPRLLDVLHQEFDIGNYS